MNVILICVECGSEFEVEPYRAQKAKYCSRACFVKRQFPVVQELGHAALRGRKPWNYQYKNKAERLEARRIRQRASYQTSVEERERALAQAVKWSEENPEKVAEIQRQYRERHPTRAKARAAITRKVARMEMPSASELLCSICGKQANHYHHHFGYEQAHWYDVIPVCQACHIRLHKP